MQKQAILGRLLLDVGQGFAQQPTADRKGDFGDIERLILRIFADWSAREPRLEPAVTGRMLGFRDHDLDSWSTERAYSVAARPSPYRIYSEDVRPPNGFFNRHENYRKDYY